MLRSVAPSVPPALAEVIDLCLRKRADDRFANGEELADALGKALEGGESAWLLFTSDARDEKSGVGHCEQRNINKQQMHNFVLCQSPEYRIEKSQQLLTVLSHLWRWLPESYHRYW